MSRNAVYSAVLCVIVIGAVLLAGACGDAKDTSSIPRPAVDSSEHQASTTTIPSAATTEQVATDAGTELVLWEDGWLVGMTQSLGFLDGMD